MYTEAYFSWYKEKFVRTLNGLQSNNSYLVKQYECTVRGRDSLISQCIKNKTKISVAKEFNMILKVVQLLEKKPELGLRENIISRKRKSNGSSIYTMLLKPYLEFIVNFEYCLLCCFNPHPRTFFIAFRESGRQTEKHRLVASYTCPYRGSYMLRWNIRNRTCNLGMCPDWETNLQLFGYGMKL